MAVFFTVIYCSINQYKRRTNLQFGQFYLFQKVLLLMKKWNDDSPNFVSFQASSAKNVLRAYGKTPATAKLAMWMENRESYLVGFFVGSQKTLKFILIR